MTRRGAMVRALLALLVAPFVFAAPAAAATPPAPWSPPVGGLRGRLVADPPTIPAGDRFRIWLELYNTTSAPIVVREQDALAFVPDLRDAHGPVKTTSGRTEVLSSSAKRVILPGGQARLELTINGSDAPRATLDVTTHIWQLPSGHYELSGRYTAFGASSPMLLPPIALEVH